jgi:hypothetical protein
MTAAGDPQTLLRRSLESRRIHSAYLISGAGEAPREAALAFVRALVCESAGAQACERCGACRRSRTAADASPVVIDGSGKRGPLLRHVGDHPDLLWVERGADDTRVRIAQIRALQSALRLRSHEGGRRAAVIADAEWLNAESQNALLRLLEEPPEHTTIVLVTASAAGLLPTVRSRCQRVALPSADPRTWTGSDAPAEAQAWLERFERLASASVPELLDWAEEFRGDRAQAVAGMEALLETGAAWLRARAGARAAGGGPTRPVLDAFDSVLGARQALAQRNANPQMVAERVLLALREAVR